MDNLTLSPNQKRILDVIWRKGPVARVEISRLTHLSSMSVTRITKELDDFGLLVEDVHRTGARGQPVRPLLIKADAAYAAGVYFSTKTLQVGLVDLSGALVDSREASLDAGTPQAVAQAANQLILDMLSGGTLQRNKLVGVGFALPGDFIVDRKRLNEHALFPNFGGDDLGQALADEMDFPVFVENDGASAALGERLMGIGQRIQHFLLVHIGHGIGAGLVLDGDLYRGSKGNSGIIGVQFPNDQPRPTGQDLFEVLKAGGIAVEDFNDLANLRPQNCPPLQRWIDRAAEQLRHALWITARMLDPEAIIIGGRLPAHLLQELVARIDDEAFCNEGVLLPRPRVFASSLGSAGGMIGAAAVPLHDCFFRV